MLFKSTHLFVFGGRTKKQLAASSIDQKTAPGTDSVQSLSNDVFVMDLSSSVLSWTRVATSGSAPTPRYGHAACLVGSRMYVYGGFESISAIHSPSDRTLYYLDLGMFRDSRLRSIGLNAEWHFCVLQRTRSGILWQRTAPVRRRSFLTRCQR